MLFRSFYPAFNNDLLLQQNDQAIFNVDAGRLAFATDSFIVSPLFFPGGNIGSLAVNGTINDIALGGATPLYLSASFILEEGLPLKNLLTIAKTMGTLQILDQASIDKLYDRYQNVYGQPAK